MYTHIHNIKKKYTNAVYSLKEKLKRYIFMYIRLITVFFNSVKRIGINSRLVNNKHTHTHESRPKIA